MKNESNEKLYNIRHSLAHIMASAVMEMFPKANLGVGPVIENGFYYDFLLPRPLSPEDLQKIEKRMRALIKENLDFKKEEMSLSDGKKFFKDLNQTFKVELINDLEKFGTTKAKEIAIEDESLGTDLDLNAKTDKLSIYRTGKFVDLCRGPHVKNTSEIPSDAFKLDKISGAYWRGDQKNPQMQRIYGLAFESRSNLDEYLKMRKELEKRDHKKIGPELELFMFHATSPGMPYWLPKGVILLNELVNFWREEHSKRNYQEIVSPLLNKKELYITSGHFEHYWPDMFKCESEDNEVYGVKAMNCPNAMIVFGSKPHSYRDLPLRLSDTDTLHRNELSGTLNGLLRVREFRQDDAHIYVTEKQIGEEYERIFEIVEKFYSIFNMSYSFRLGTRPKEFMGDEATWNNAEEILKKILKKSKKEFTIAEGDGAFYGPKVDIIMKDAFSRDWQLGTVQLDFQQPRRFNLEYTDADGKKKTPIAIHRVIYGSLERFIGILIEHFAGAFPVWLSPMQVKILPISEKQNKYAEKVLAELKENNIRVELDDRSESIGKKIREAEMQKIPYMLIIGEKETKLKSISVRARSASTSSGETKNQKDLGSMKLKKFLSKLQKEIKNKSL